MSDEVPPKASKRRFIAGAVCPQCRALDRLVISRIDEQTQRRECVSCGFSDETTADSTAPIPRGKAERTNITGDTSLQTVRLIDPKKST